MKQHDELQLNGYIFHLLHGCKVDMEFIPSGRIMFYEGNAQENMVFQGE